MNLLVLGRGKTGALVAEFARERHHRVRVLGGADNKDGCGLTPDVLREVDTVIDFTTPGAVLANIDACLREKKNMVVGTTGWHGKLDRVRASVAEAGIGFLYGANFSIGVNLFFETVRTASEAAGHGYSGQIFERHHQQKKDAPSGTALVLQKIVKERARAELEITSFREGDVVGLHELIFDSPNDRIYLCHDAKSRRGYAEGAVLGAEWLSGRKGFFEFKDVWREL
ncbi:MAG: dihydrodipicolinate reductase C-terminal domain-containing protein [Terriglobales bacterium]